MRPSFLRTSARVAPGQLTREAWRAVDEAGLVLTEDPETAKVFAEQGVEVELVDDVASALRRTGGPGPVVVLTPYDVPGSAFLELVEVMDRLRTECPWDQEQTHRSLAKYLLEETYETLEAIESGDVDHLREELGDLLLQVCFHARIATESGDAGFDVDDVARGIAEKLVYRHPHVFAGLEVADAEEVDRNWEALKAAEKKRESPLDGIPRSLPALAWADKVLGRLEKAGALEAATDADDLGDRLLRIVHRARAEGLDPEQALRDAVTRLIHSKGLT